jgi:hypothetical protein
MQRTDIVVDKQWANVQAETDPHRLAQRQKQIDFGKRTSGYINYINAIPRECRGKTHPRTPDMRRSYTKRHWDAAIRQWRRQLHVYDSDPSTNTLFSADQSSYAGAVVPFQNPDDEKEDDELLAAIQSAVQSMAMLEEEGATHDNEQDGQ